jgi:hypothetical protein
LLRALNTGRGPLVTAEGAVDARRLGLETTQLRSFEISVPDGQCADVVAALDQGGSGLDLRLVDLASNEQHSLVRGRLLCQSRACASGRPRALRVELRLDAGKADALVLSRVSPSDR